VFDPSDTKKIEMVPQRVAPAAFQLDETGVNGSSFHAQAGRVRHDKRGLRPVQIPPRAHTLTTLLNKLSGARTGCEHFKALVFGDAGSWIGVGWASELT
jgi:hypothetical protein